MPVRVYRNLLKRYMEHILDEEGITYVDQGMFGRSLTAEDKGELRQIEAEIALDRKIKSVNQNLRP